MMYKVTPTPWKCHCDETKCYEESLVARVGKKIIGLDNDNEYLRLFRCEPTSDKELKEKVCVLTFPVKQLEANISGDLNPDGGGGEFNEEVYLFRWGCYGEFKLSLQEYVTKWYKNNWSFFDFVDSDIGRRNSYRRYCNVTQRQWEIIINAIRPLILDVIEKIIISAVKQYYPNVDVVRLKNEK